MPDGASLASVAGGIPVWLEDGEVHIDVRGLEPPRPFVAVIELIERQGIGNRIVVRIHRDPVFLYPELAERGWSWERLPAREGEVRLRLLRNND